MFRKLLTVLLVLLGYGSAACASTFTDDRTVYINNVIDAGNLGDLGDSILRMAEKNKKPITILLNSPGGSVYEGFKFISRMHAVQAKGVKIQCIVVDLAASMAFQILTQCDERYTLDNSILLWHRARVFIFLGVLTGPVSSALGRDLERTDSLIFSQISKAFVNMPTSYLSYHFENETAHVGSQLAADAPRFITSYDYIEGLFEAIKADKFDTSLKHSRRSPFEMALDVGRGREIMYIWEQYFNSVLGQTPIMVRGLNKN